MKYVFSSVLLLTALAAGQPLTPCGGGGPDSFGYRYFDSDTTCPGSPTFNWVEIKGSGTRITMLGDDNDAGPFPIGFEFPYYAYRVSSCYVGADGLIAFNEHAYRVSPFDTIPNPAPPNNIVAPLMCDLDCGHAGSPQGSVWYWTSADADSFIVEYDSISFWSTGGNNTFQIVLSRSDSTITFQYKEQTGEPFGGWVSNQTGIEDASGSIGLNYLTGRYPPQNMYHDSLAVRFIPPDSNPSGIHDAGVPVRRGAVSATVVRRLPPGAVAFDAMGRRVLDAKPGICFVRGEGRGVGDAGRMRKVVVAR